MGALFLKAHAKVNLYLKVGDRLTFGYHKITSVMQSITLADRITISAADKLFFECDDPQLDNKDNLVFKAASLIADYFEVSTGARISLVKVIPVAAGLGGGSADAAATLIGLDRFWNLNMPSAQLALFASELGADVTFCLTGGTALATGVGEIIKPLSSIDLGNFLVVKPKGGLSSGQVYERFDAIGGRKPGSVDKLLQAVEDGHIEAVIKELVNDLEPAAKDLMPDIEIIRKIATEAGATACLVSGSGPAMLIIADDQETRENIMKSLANCGRIWSVTCAKQGTTLIMDET